jgi:hypothetical protein
MSAGLSISRNRFQQPFSAGSAQACPGVDVILLIGASRMTIVCASAGLIKVNPVCVELD